MDTNKHRRPGVKIISGGQTGADRAALDFAIAHGLEHGGWCPRGRLAEDGRIAVAYQLTETPGEELNQRTEWNVRDSEATVIFSIAPGLTGGSRKTVEFAIQQKKPWLHLSRTLAGSEATERLIEFLLKYKPARLNVAGTRDSEEPEVGGFVREVLEDVWTKILVRRKEL